MGKSLLSGSLELKDGESLGISPPPKILQMPGKKGRSGKTGAHPVHGY